MSSADSRLTGADIIAVLNAFGSTHVELRDGSPAGKYFPPNEAELESLDGFVALSGELTNRIQALIILLDEGSVDPWINRPECANSKGLGYDIFEVAATAPISLRSGIWHYDIPRFIAMLIAIKPLRKT
jgi:hypothetical protein